MLGSCTADSGTSGGALTCARGQIGYRHHHTSPCRLSPACGLHGLELEPRGKGVRPGCHEFRGSPAASWPTAPCCRSAPLCKPCRHAGFMGSAQRRCEWCTLPTPRSSAPGTVAIRTGLLRSPICSGAFLSRRSRCACLQGRGLARGRGTGRKVAKLWRQRRRRGAGAQRRALPRACELGQTLGRTG